VKKIDLVIAGVGGQGNLLLAKLLSLVALEEGWDVKRSEIKGLAQRGGSVLSQVRMGEKIWSPLIQLGSADFLLGLDPVEALRNFQFLSPEGKALVSSNFAPNPIKFSEEEVLEKARSLKFLLIPALDLAKKVGSPQSANIVILGALSNFLPFSLSTFEKIMKENLKRLQEENLKAFALGREEIQRIS
jgi:indolepyruvate ferredoxin oxidoreductase beta subunit